jgi:hypothetical protein
MPRDESIAKKVVFSRCLRINVFLLISRLETIDYWVIRLIRGMWFVTDWHPVEYNLCGRAPRGRVD